MREFRPGVDLTHWYGLCKVRIARFKVPPWVLHLVEDMRSMAIGSADYISVGPPGKLKRKENNKGCLVENNQWLFIQSLL